VQERAAANKKAPAKLNAESSSLPILRKQLDKIEKGIDNLVNAIQAGIITQSTKQRLEQLEAEKSEISVQILKEEIAKPTVTKDDILAYLVKYRKLNMKQLDHRRRLIDSFVNAIYLFDDYLVITFNYKEGTKRVTFAEIEEAFGSDLSSLTAPKHPDGQRPSGCFCVENGYAESAVFVKQTLISIANSKAKRSR